MRVYIKTIFTLSVVIILFGCAASSHVIVGETRAPISPEEVRLYSKPPANHEEIAIVESSSKNSWAVTDQGKTDVAIQRLKEQAASLGANGILINVTGDIATGSVGMGSANTYGNTTYGSGVSSSVLHKVAKGMAIYVPVSEQR